MSTRKPIPDAVQQQILLRSRRRCALCAHLDGDYREKQGQLAHLDQNAENPAEENLVFLCLFHHDRYDGKTSQSKGYLLSEVRAARDELYKFIEDGKLHAEGGPISRGREKDRERLVAIIEQMGPRTMGLLRDHNFAGFSFELTDKDGLDTIVYDWREPHYQFIDEELEELCKKFVEDGATFLESVATHTFVVHGSGVTRASVPKEWEERIPERFREVVKEIHTAAAAVCVSYDNLIRRARQKLEA